MVASSPWAFWLAQCAPSSSHGRKSMLRLEQFQVSSGVQAGRGSGPRRTWPSEALRSESQQTSLSEFYEASGKTQATCFLCGRLAIFCQPAVSCAYRFGIFWESFLTCPGRCLLPDSSRQLSGAKLPACRHGCRDGLATRRRMVPGLVLHPLLHVLEFCQHPFLRRDPPSRG